MVLADTSVWIDHLRNGNSMLADLLLHENVVCHPFVIGEIACGTMRKRVEIISLLRELPSVPVADDDEILLFIEEHTLMGRGLGLIDIHLLASTILAAAEPWTLDIRLKKMARELGVQMA